MPFLLDHIATDGLLVIVIGCLCDFTAENECDIDNGGCEQVCINTFPFFNCSCEDGYFLNSDRFTCSGKTL